MPILLTLIQLVLILAAFSLCGYLFVLVKRELQTYRRRSDMDHHVAVARIEALERDLADVRDELRAIQAPSIPAPIPPRGLNLNKRTQALRMMRLGEGADNIATALSLPRREVELLVKVQRLLLDSSQFPAN